MSDRVSRRGFVGNSLAGSVYAVWDFLTGANESEANERPFWTQYYDGTMNILRGLRDTQLALIKSEMLTAYERQKKGGTVYSQITAGHFPTEETALDRIGQPGVFAFLPRGAKEDEYAKLGPNDMIITNTINLNNIEAMKRGIRIVGVTVNYYPSIKTPPKEGYQIEYNEKILTLEDTVNVTIDSQAPWHNGLVHTSYNPDFPIIPGGGLAQAAVYWMCAAELAGLHAAKGKESGSGGAEYYCNTCIERALMVGQDKAKFSAVCAHIADLVLNGAEWHVFGANHALVSDAIGVANGPMITRHYRVDDLKKGDVVLITAYSSDNEEELKVARESRVKGAYVLAIAPFSEDGDASGERLYKEVDVAFNNYSPESWGVVPIPGNDRKVCPTSGVIGDMILWLIVAEWTYIMAQRGEFPYYWKGFFMNGGREHNDSVRPYYNKRGW